MCAAVRMSCFFSKREVLRMTFNKSIQLKGVLAIEILYGVGNSGGRENEVVPDRCCQLVGDHKDLLMLVRGFWLLCGTVLYFTRLRLWTWLIDSLNSSLSQVDLTHALPSLLKYIWLVPSMYYYRFVDETAVQHKKKKMKIHYVQLQRTSLERTSR